MVNVNGGNRQERSRTFYTQGEVTGEEHVDFNGFLLSRYFSALRWHAFCNGMGTISDFISHWEIIATWHASSNVYKNNRRTIVLEVGKVYTDNFGRKVVIVACEFLDLTKRYGRQAQMSEDALTSLVSVVIGRDVETGDAVIYHENGSSFTTDGMDYIPEVRFKTMGF